jgi:hypothetical protein
MEDPELWFGAVARHVFDPAPSKEQIKEAIRRSSLDRLKAQEEAHGYYGIGIKPSGFSAKAVLGSGRGF